MLVERLAGDQARRNHGGVAVGLARPGGETCDIAPLNYAARRRRRVAAQRRVGGSRRAGRAAVVGDSQRNRQRVGNDKIVRRGQALVGDLDSL